MSAATPIPATEIPTLTVILPTFNEASWLPETLDHLRTALVAGGWDDAEILIVDDGSTDGTGELLEADRGLPGLRVLRQENAGRLAARRAGLAAATGDLVLFLDSRVHADPGSLRFLREQLTESPERLIWNGHAVTASTSMPWTRFWDAVVFLAWRRYLRNPRTTSYGEEEFDWYPKGTTFFVAPREWLIDAIEESSSLSTDPKLANDDTLMIRSLLRYSRINISPGFSCTYHPRSTFSAFMRNARHRGAMLVDGHLRPGLRFHRPFLVLVSLLPFVGWWVTRSPRRFAASAVGGSVGIAATARAAGVPTRDAASLGALAIPFSAAYGAGIVRGFLARRSAR